MKRIIPVLMVLIALMMFSSALADVLTLPASLNTIEEEAFYGNKSLDKVVLGENMTTIGPRAFSNSGLKEVTLARSITSIAEDAFEGCGQFKVNAPIGSYAYNWCVEHGYIGKPEDTPAEFFTYSTINGLYAQITGYTGTDTIISVPSEIDDYIIQKIGNNALKNNKSIEYVYLPDTVEEIGSSAFYGCTTLVGIDIGNSVKTIGSDAFNGCTSLIGVAFPSSLTITGSGLFRNCVNLEFFDYPVNWVKAGDYTIAGCSKITKLTIPEGATLVPDNAFGYCNNLVEIEISSTITKMGQSAFRNCLGLTTIVIPGNVVSLNGFLNCTNLTDVKLNIGIKEIGSSAFEGCTSIATIDLPEGLETIGESTFRGCTNLLSALLPDSVTKIGKNAYENCKLLDTFKYPVGLSSITTGTFVANNVFRGCEKLRRITVPEGVTVIPANTFNGANYLRYVDLPNGLKELGNSAFEGCTAITTLELPDGLEKIGESCFNGCTYLQSALLPDSVTQIGKNAYENCKNLATFKYPKGLTKITTGTFVANNVFRGCEKLTSITVPQGVIRVPDNTFNGANFLKNVNLPDGLIEIGGSAFEGCSSITSLALPESLEKIGEYAFKDCTYLESALLPDTVTVIGRNAYENCQSLSAFKYPKGLSKISTGTFYAGDVFRGCKVLDHITIPDGVTIIPANTFRGANYLVDVDIPSSVQKIEGCAFNGCTVLEKVYLGYNVTSIAKDAFGSCPVLTIWTEYGATGLQYAIDNSITYYYLSLNGETYPTGIKYRGDDFDFYGFVRSNHNVIELSASVVSASSKKTVLAVDVQPNITMCDLSEILNSTLAISTLDLGEYTYSISASTDLDKETFVISRFTIVPAPLRSNTDGIFAPCGSMSLGVPFDISGILTANYAIEKTIVGVYNTTGTAIYSCTLYPNTNSVDISAASTALQFSQMTSGQYVFRVYLTGNGETIVAYESTFTILSKTKAADREAAFNAAFNNSSYNENAILRVAAVEMADAAYHEWASKKKLESFGFNFDEMETSFVWGVHGCPYTLGWKDIQNSNGTTSRLFAIVCTGTHIDVEWISNVTVIDNGNFHYGFNTAAQRVLNGFKKYLNKKQGDVDIADCKVLITGHSRGAAVANILAGYYLPQLGLKPYNIYAYTFACPAVYRGDIPDIPYIFNYNLGGDLVGRVPFEDWGYTRFGETIVYANGSNLYGISVIDKDTMDRFAETLGSLSSENQMRFFQTMKNASGLIDVSNPVFVAYFALRTVVKECAEAYKVGSFHYNQLGNDTETVINGIINTHQQSTYVKWISNM